MRRMTSHQLRAFCRQNQVTMTAAEEFVTDNDYSSSPEPQDPDYFRSGPHVHNEASYVAKWPFEKVFMPNSGWVGTREYQLQAAYGRTPKEVISFALHAFLDEDDKHVQLAVLSNGTNVNRFMTFQFRLFTEWSRFEYVTKHYIVYIIDNLSLWVNETLLNVDDMKLWGQVSNSTNVTLEMSFKYNVDHDYICHEPGHKKTVSCYLAKRQFKKISMRWNPSFSRTALPPDRRSRKRRNDEPLPQFSTLKVSRTQANPLLFRSPPKMPSVDELMRHFGWGTRGYYPPIPTTRRAIAEQSTYPLDIRQAQVTADRASHPIMISEPYTIAEQSTYPLDIRQAQVTADRASHPIMISEPYTIAEQSTYPLDIRQAHVTADRASHPIAISEPYTIADQPTHSIAIRQPEGIFDEAIYPRMRRQLQTVEPPSYPIIGPSAIGQRRATGDQLSYSMSFRQPQVTCFPIGEKPRSRASLPQKDTSFLPQKDTSFLPQKDTSFLPQKNTSFLPQKNTSFLPHKNTSYLPQKDKYFLPQKDTSFLPQKDTSFIPQKDTSFLPQKNTSFLPHKDTSFLPQKDKSFFPQKDTSFLPRKDTSFLPQKDTSSLSQKDTSSLPQKDTSSQRQPTTTRLIIYCDGRRRQYKISLEILEKASPVMKAFIDFSKPDVTANGDCYCEMDGVIPFVLETLIRYLTNDSYSENIFKSRLMKETARKLQIDLG